MPYKLTHSSKCIFPAFGKTEADPSSFSELYKYGKAIFCSVFSLPFPHVITWVFGFTMQMNKKFLRTSNENRGHFWKIEIGPYQL